MAKKTNYATYIQVLDKIGYSHARTAIILGISKPMLKKYFRGELLPKQKEMITKNLNVFLKTKQHLM